MPTGEDGGSCHIQGWRQLSTAEETTVSTRSCRVRGLQDLTRSGTEEFSVLRLYVLPMGYITDGFEEEFP